MNVQSKNSTKMNIKYLEKERLGRSSIKGYKLKRVYQSSNVSCYKKISIKSGHYSYEVFERNFTKPRFDSEKGYDLIENYPHDNLFGMYAFDCSTKNKAIAKIKFLIKRCKEREKKSA
ncbi:hypothetical protein [Clostridium chrysemydis]|uniref:hypothetical protein n=1 Tax=Clostridium chrysemydis TaxID=2665504 RepID=UPI003F3662F9